ncbi:hypothetical protein [Amorphus orientalis]|uniref:Uncharacterized protein n=1 Tax=Amorphus orientalis TaxID=649198 RepID=A0AAE3VTA0_9HYPH|nr:hypothetical protein [Amorphus orientalis]MDQ0317753.1 hypothetical protein [Amorphus orientalis]
MTRRELKIVPKSNPNGEGRWIDASDELSASIGRGEKLFTRRPPEIPDDHFLVAVRRKQDAI